MGVNCASVVTNTKTHYSICKWLLEHGIDVLLEKPMCETLAEAKELIEIADSNGRILQVGLLERFNPAFLAVKDRLEDPIFFEVRRISPFTGRGADVDVILDLMIHDIDIISHVVNRPLVKVDAIGMPVLTEFFDIANARLTFEGGVVANLTASRIATKEERTVKVFQHDNYLSVDYKRQKLVIYSRSKQQDKSLPQIDISEYDVEERDVLGDELNSFINCVSTGGCPEVSGQAGLSSLAIVEKIQIAMRESLKDVVGSGNALKTIGDE